MRSWQRAKAEGLVGALIGQRLAVALRSVHAHVVREHGDNEVGVWRRALMAGMGIAEFFAQPGAVCGPETQGASADQVVHSAAEIIERKGATYCGIGLGIRSLVQATLREQNNVLTVSALMAGQLDVSDVCLSLPSVEDRRGARGVLVPAMNEGKAGASGGRHGSSRPRRTRSAYRVAWARPDVLRYRLL